MAIPVTYNDAQRKAQGAEIARIFRLPDVSQVTDDWSMESTGRVGAVLKIELVAFIDNETVTRLLNGIPDE